ncbi:hypothetical protein AGR7C_Cc160315 [Agrobacterium deltaense Zutra 3/1]|uniref:Uncharacterized protein n=1 Tax=Agrobacterium deltaense Zutra 3/1 TaxID=1183427 RepID=A0A1S7PQ61_9HYPH|nr:hypothetical protein AGR7C_Cc160315 [Agrobacterium deltaense Zutra 3/1]
MPVRLKKPSVRPRAKASPPLTPSTALTKTRCVRKTSSIRKPIATATTNKIWLNGQKKTPDGDIRGFCLLGRGEAPPSVLPDISPSRGEIESWLPFDHLNVAILAMQARLADLPP